MNIIQGLMEYISKNLVDPTYNNPNEFFGDDTIFERAMKFYKLFEKGGYDIRSKNDVLQAVICISSFPRAIDVNKIAITETLKEVMHSHIDVRDVRRCFMIDCNCKDKDKDYCLCQ